MEGLTVNVARYLSHKRFQPPMWAVNDCNTFIVEWHDYFYQTNHFELCNFDYDGPVSAARWQRKFLAAPDFLQMIGYQQVLLASSGDVLLQDLGPFWCAYLVMGRQAYTIDHKLGLVSIELNKLDNYTIWSKDA